jgi:PAS domain S-box-containing protein
LAGTCLLSGLVRASEGPNSDEPVSIAVGPILPPLLERDANGHLQGFVIDFISEAARRAKMRVEFVLVPDLQSLHAIDPDTTPLASWLLSEDPLHGYHRFERGYLTLHSAVFRRNAPGASRDLEAADLGEIIAVESSEAHLDLLDDGAIRVFTVPTMDDAVRLLASGEHDTLFANEMAALDAIKRLQLRSVAEAPSPEMHMHQRFALHRSDARPDLEAALAPVLRLMRHDGTFDSLYKKWFGPLEDQGAPSQVFALTAASVAVGGGGLAFVLFLSRRRLVALVRGQDKTLRENESRLEELLGDVEAVVWEADLQGRFTYVSKYSEKMIGYTPEECCATSDFWETVLLHPEDRAETVCACTAATLQGEDVDLDYRLVTRSGQVLRVRDIAHVVKSPHGKCLGLRGIFVDVTERRRAEEALGMKEAQLTAIMAASPTGIFRLDLEGRVTFSNQEAARITGITSGAIDLRRWLDAVHPDDRAAVVAAWKLVRDENISDHREYRFVRPDGQVVWVLDRGQPEHDAAGRFIGFIGTLTDITQLKRAQEALRESEEKFRLVAESALVGIAISDHGKFIFSNDTMVQLTGYAPEELAALDREDLTRLLMGDGPHAPVYAALRRLDGAEGSTEPVVVEDARLRHKDGKDRWARLTISRLFPDRPFPRLFVCVETTERKRAEEALKESEERFRRVAESAMVGIAVVEGERYIYLNDALIEITGYSRDELAGLDRAARLANLLMPEDAQRVAAAAAGADAARSGVASTRFPELRLRRKDGSIGYVSLLLSPMYTDRPYPVVIVVVDITERKRAEDALRDRERMFRRTEQLARVGGWEINLEANSGGWSDEVRRIHEVPEDYIPSLESGLAFFSPEDRDTLRAAAERAVETGAPWQFEGELTTAKGRKIWVRTTGERVLENGKAVGLVGAIQDITDLKETERSLRLSKQRLRAIVDSEPECVKLMDENCTLLEMNPAGLAMIGADSLEQARGRNTLDLVAPEYRDLYRAGVTDVFQGKTSLQEFEIVGLKGTRRWMEQHAVPLWDVSRPGCVEHMLAVSRDVTVRKQAEEALRRSEARLALVFNSTSDLQVLFRIEAPDRFIIEAANRAYTEYMRHTFPQASIDVVGRERGEFLASLGFSSEDVALELAKYQEAVERRVTVSYAVPFVARGAEILLDVSIEPVLGPEGRCTHALWNARNVTERKRAEEALEETRRALDVLMSNLPGMAYRCRNDRDWTLEFTSEGCLPLTGYTPDELVTRAVVTYGRDIIHAEDQEAVWIGVQAGLNEKRPFELVYRIRTKSAELRWVWEQGRGVYSPQGDLLALEGFIVDITARKAAEEALRTSEDMLRRTAQLARVGGWVFDVRTNSMDWSDEVRRIHEVPHDFVPTVDSILAFFSPADQERVRAVGAAALQGGTPWQFEVELTTAKGRKIWVHTTGEPIRENGRFVRLIGAMQDITERLRAEESTRLSHERLNEAQHIAKVGSWELDLTTNHLEWSNEIYRIFEFDESQSGASYGAYFSLVHPDDRDTVEQTYTQLPAMKTPFEIVHRLKMPDGRIKWIHGRLNTYHDASGNSLRSAGTIQDITERKIADEERRAIELKMQQAQKLESLGVLTGGIAHDFNNLLAGILGNADLALQDAPPGDPVHESVTQIAVAARRAADLVNEMLAYSGRSNFVVRNVQVGEMVREMAKLLQVTLSKKAVLRYELDDKAPPIQADPAQIQQVVMNLITNASDALGDDPGVITLRSGVEHCTQDDLRAYAPHELAHPGLYVFLEVSDTGCGMDAKTIERIFDPFFTTKFTGRGLGLAATLGIVRGHQGGLRVVSRVGHGTTFRVIFPAATDHEPLETFGGPPATAAPGRAGVLLVVDDDPRVRDFVVRALQLLGHEVLSAADGRQALEVFERHAQRIDGVLLDITMPEMNGEDVLRALHAQHPGLPAVLMSGYSDSEMRSRLARNGHAAFLRKPFSLDTLRQVVDTLLAPR